jgi:hypothetical protein
MKIAGLFSGEYLGILYAPTCKDNADIARYERMLEGAGSPSRGMMVSRSAGTRGRQEGEDWMTGRGLTAREGE